MSGWFPEFDQVDLRQFQELVSLESKEIFDLMILEAPIIHPQSLLLTNLEHETLTSHKKGVCLEVELLSLYK
jgi:hypothetical protein